MPVKMKRADLAWLVRAAFETGYRCGKPDTQPNDWLNEEDEYR